MSSLDSLFGYKPSCIYSGLKRGEAHSAIPAEPSNAGCDGDARGEHVESFAARGVDGELLLQLSADANWVARPCYTAPRGATIDYPGGMDRLTVQITSKFEIYGI